VSGPPGIVPGAEPFSLGDGETGVLMIHGFTGSPASMRPIGEWLAANGLRVEGVRLPGHGTSIDDLRDRRWTEWVEEAGSGLDRLRSACSTLVVFAQSMGGTVALHLAATRPGDLDGIVLVNPYVFDARLYAAPVGRRLLRDVKGIADDISIEGVTEGGYARMPLPAIAQMGAMLRVVRGELARIRQPLLVFRSGTDHVIPRSNARRVLRRIGSSRKDLVECPGSFHVVTLDRDAPPVRERTLAFVREIAAGGEGGTTPG
jgi:carboxylesterase